MEFNNSSFELCKEIKYNFRSTKNVSYRLRSINIWENSEEDIEAAHYYVYTCMQYKDGWIWLRIDDAKVTIVNFDVTKDEDVKSTCASVVYEKYNGNREDVPNNIYDEATFKVKDRNRKKKEIEELNKLLALCPELSNESTVCFFNVTFQAISFMNFESLHKELNIGGKDFFDEESLLHFFSHLNKPEATV